VPENEIGHLKERLKEEYNAVPIMLDDDLADKHYNGFSSKLLPLHRRTEAHGLRLDPMATLPLSSR